MQVEQGTAQDTEPSNQRTKVSHEQANASNQASLSSLQDTAGHSLLVAENKNRYMIIYQSESLTPSYMCMLQSYTHKMAFGILFVQYLHPLLWKAL